MKYFNLHIQIILLSCTLCFVTMVTKMVQASIGYVVAATVSVYHQAHRTLFFVSHRVQKNYIIYICLNSWNFYYFIQIVCHSDPIRWTFSYRNTAMLFVTQGRFRDKQINTDYKKTFTQFRHTVSSIKMLFKKLLTLCLSGFLKVCWRQFMYEQRV